MKINSRGAHQLEMGAYVSSSSSCASGGAQAVVPPNSTSSSEAESLGLLCRPQGCSKRHHDFEGVYVEKTSCCYVVRKSSQLVVHHRVTPLGCTSSTHDVLEERGRRDARESILTGRKLFALLEGYLMILWTVRCSEAKSKWCVSFLLCVPLPHRRLFSCRLPASPDMATFQTCRNLLRHSDASLKPQL